VGSWEALEPLIGALGDRSAAVREAAAIALGGLDCPDAADALIAALHDRERRVRDAAESGLKQLGDSQVTVTVIEALREQYESRLARWR
jgi:HEAT repeat protein